MNLKDVAKDAAKKEAEKEGKKKGTSMWQFVSKDGKTKVRQLSPDSWQLWQDGKTETIDLKTLLKKAVDLTQA
jgi:sarcosine oxidase gamma subunit